MGKKGRKGRLSDFSMGIQAAKQTQGLPSAEQHSDNITNTPKGRTLAKAGRNGS